MADDAIAVKGSRLAAEIRHELAVAWNVAPDDADRLALSLGLAFAENGKAHPLKWLLARGALRPDVKEDAESDGAQHSLGRIAAGDDLIGKLLELGPGPSADRLRASLNHGYRCLDALLRLSGRDADRVLDRLVEALSADVASAPVDGAGAAPGPAIGVTIGTDPSSGRPVTWHFNREKGETTSANLRIAGQQGKGKTTALLGILLDVARSDASTGFIVFDCKGDLSGPESAAFREETRAKVLSPLERPIPINPFDAPRGSKQNVNILAQQFASVFNELVRIGSVQEGLMRKGLADAYEAAFQAGRGGPSLWQVRESVRAAYDAEPRKWNDTVAATLNKLVEVPCFADRTEEFPIEQVFAQRWIVNLSDLGDLWIFVAYVLLQCLRNVANALGEAPLERATSIRTIRGVIAIDEAHRYLKEGAKLRPLQDLVRTGRSRGIPVFLSSQSINDFASQTEWEELLGTTLLFAHGMPPDAAAVQGALKLKDSRTARDIAGMAMQLDQFFAFTHHYKDSQEMPLPVRVTPIHERLGGGRR